jgi:hypothetical protein
MARVTPVGQTLCRADVSRKKLSAWAGRLALKEDHIEVDSDVTRRKKIGEFSN